MGASSSLPPTGLDAVVVEPGLNARHALAIVASQAAGAINYTDLGGGLWQVAVTGAGVGITRILGTINAGTRQRIITAITPPP